MVMEQQQFVNLVSFAYMFELIDPKKIQIFYSNKKKLFFFDKPIDYLVEVQWLLYQRNLVLNRDQL